MRTWQSEWERYCALRGVSNSEAQSLETDKAAFRFAYESGVQEGKDEEREQYLMYAKNEKAWESEKPHD